MNKPKMWRQRFIPNEIKDISKDEVIYRDEKILITKWDVINPREDFKKGISYVMLDKGIKISKMFLENGDVVKYYCDIIEVEYHSDEDEYVFRDLLLDVEIYPDNRIKVLDADELADALEQGLITKEQACRSLRILNEILGMIYSNQFPPDEILKAQI